MPKARILRRHTAELVVVFVGVALAFAVENLREDINERAAEGQYLSGFRRDLTADLAMLREQHDARQAQVDNARLVLEFYDGRPIDPQPFFEAYFSALFALRTGPNRNTMDEVLNSGSPKGRGMTPWRTGTPSRRSSATYGSRMAFA